MNKKHAQEQLAGFSGRLHTRWGVRKLQVKKNKKKRIKK